MVQRQPARVASATPLLAFTGLGLPAGAIGVAWPYMRISVHAPLSGLGIVIAGWTGAYFLVSALTGALSTRVKASTLLMIACVLAAAGTFGFASAPNLVVLAAASLLVGTGSGLIDATVNVRVSLTRGVRFMGWLHASWAVGAAIGPQTVVVSLRTSGSWRAAFVVMAMLFVVVGLLIGWHHDWIAAGPGGPGLSEEANSVPPGRPLILILLIGVFLLGSGIEGTTGDWSYSGLNGGRSLSAGAAGLSVSLFWITLAAGRMALGVAGHRIEATRLLDVCLSAIVLTTVGFWLAPPLVSAFIALPLLGLSISIIFPLLLSLTPGRVGPARTSQAVGYQLAAGTLGAGGFPAITGIVLQTFGLGTLGPTLTLLALALLGLHIASRATRDG